MTRDEIAQAMQDSAGNSWGDEAHFQRFADLVADAEREACETIADAEASSWGGFDSGFTASVNIAAAIRARGNA